MATQTSAHGAHEAPQGFIRRWVFSLDHKVIGIQYMFLALASVFVGTILSLMIRAQLAFPEKIYPYWSSIFSEDFAARLASPDWYLTMVTMHGTMMVFFVLTTAPQGGFGNYVLPIQIGALDMAFPRLNMLSFWTTLLGFLTLMAAFFVEGGAPLGGWTAYARLSALGEVAGPGQGMGMNLWITSIAIFCIAFMNIDS